MNKSYLNTIYSLLFVSLCEQTSSILYEFLWRSQMLSGIFRITRGWLKFNWHLNEQCTVISWNICYLAYAAKWESWGYPGGNFSYASLSMNFRGAPIPLGKVDLKEIDFSHMITFLSKCDVIHALLHDYLEWVSPSINAFSHEEVLMK